MDDEQAFIRAIADQPDDWHLQAVFADWLADRGRQEETAWRWISTFRRKPCPFRMFRIDTEPYWALAAQKYLLPDQIEGGRGWGNWGDWDLPWPEGAGLSMLPKGLYRHLPKSTNEWDQGWSSERAYDSTAEAFQALVTAFSRATWERKSLRQRLWYGPQWVPDWTLSSKVPEGEPPEPK